MNITIKLSTILKGQTVTMQGGQSVMVMPFVQALRKLAKDPVQEHKTKYWAGRVLGQVESFVESFQKHRNDLIKQHGVKLSVLLNRRKAALDLIEVKSPQETREFENVTAQLKNLNLKPANDTELLDGEDAVAVAAFKADMDKAMDENLTIEHLTEKFKIRPTITVKGEVQESEMDGEDMLYLADLIEPPV